MRRKNVLEVLGITTRTGETSMKKTVKFDISTIKVIKTYDDEDNIFCFGADDTEIYKPEEINEALENYINYIKERNDVELEVRGTGEYGTVILRIKPFAQKILMFGSIDETKIAKEMSEKLDRIKEIIDKN